MFHGRPSACRHSKSHVVLQLQRAIEAMARVSLFIVIVALSCSLPKQTSSGIAQSGLWRWWCGCGHQRAAVNYTWLRWSFRQGPYSVWIDKLLSHIKNSTTKSCCVRDRPVHFAERISFIQNSKTILMKQHAILYLIVVRKYPAAIGVRICLIPWKSWLWLMAKWLRHPKFFGRR